MAASGHIERGNAAKTKQSGGKAPMIQSGSMLFVGIFGFAIGDVGIRNP